MTTPNQTQEPVIVEPKYTVEVGHDRYQNLIIKRLKVSGDDLEAVYAQLQQALSDFRMLEV